MFLFTFICIKNVMPRPRSIPKRLFPPQWGSPHPHLTCVYGGGRSDKCHSKIKQLIQKKQDGGDQAHEFGMKFLLKKFIDGCQF